MEVEIKNNNFKSEVLDYKGTVIVDFYANWCMPCKMLAPIIEKVATENNIKLAKVDVDENENLAREFGIMSIPTVYVYKNGERTSSFVGLIGENKLIEAIKD